MLKPNGSLAVAKDGIKGANRRKWVRHACSADVSCRLLLGGDTALAVERVQNLSAGGVNLVVNDLVPTGKILIVELCHVQRHVVIQREARVTYVFRTPDGRFALGGAFAWELGVRELEQLL
jgi:hypothetical protein